MKLNFRKLNASEVEARIGTIAKSGKGLSLLLYKDARVDQRLLDEVVGSTNWEKSYRRDEKGRLFCKVSIWDEEKSRFVSKEDVGTESNAEKEKGEASDSFKRACFCWGIGRELYSVPFLWVNSNDCNISTENGKCNCRDTFKVKCIEYGNDCNVSYVEIYNQNTKKTLTFGKKEVSKPIPLFETEPTEDFSINPEEAAETDPGEHRILFSCSRKGRSIREIYEKDEQGVQFLKGILTYASSNPAMKPDEPYVKEFLKTIA